MNAHYDQDEMGMDGDGFSFGASLPGVSQATVEAVEACETRSFSEAPTPEGPRCEYAHEVSSHGAGPLYEHAHEMSTQDGGPMDEEIDYLFEGDLSSSSRASIAEAAEENMLTSTIYIGGDDSELSVANGTAMHDTAEENVLTSTMSIREGNSELPMMSGARIYDTADSSELGYSSDVLGTADNNRRSHYQPVASLDAPFPQSPRLRPQIQTGTSTTASHRKQSRDGTPTEAYLESIDFQFDKVIHKIRSKHTRQALKDMDQDLSRRELFRIYRYAAEAEGEDIELFRPHTPSQDYDSDELEDPGSCEYEDDTSPCEDPESAKKRRMNSARRPSAIGRNVSSQHLEGCSSENPLAEAALASLMQSKPHLSDITPTEAQGHHPSIIPRSPHRPASRTSSLCSETRLIIEPVSAPQPLTEEALSAKDQETSFCNLPEALLPSSLIEMGSYPFRRPLEPASASSPLRKPFDSLDAASTKALVGSPMPPRTPSRPDTHRPSFAVEPIGYLGEHALHEPPMQIARSNTPSPAPRPDTDMFDSSPQPSPTPVRPIVVDWSEFEASSNVGELTALAPCAYAQDHQVSFQNPDILGAVPKDQDDHQAPFSVDERTERTLIVHANDNQPMFRNLEKVTVQVNRYAVSERMFSSSLFPPQNLAAVSAFSATDSTSTGSSSRKYPFLDAPWREPPLAPDTLSRQPSSTSSGHSRTPSPSKRSTRASRSPKKPADPFARGADEIPLNAPTGSPPLSPLTGLAGQIIQSKRGQRTPGGKGRRVQTGTGKGTRAVSAKTPRRGRQAATETESPSKRSKSTNLGVQGESGVKVTKARAGGPRSTSRKVSTRTPRKKKGDTGGDKVPDVPPLPIEMDVDQPQQKSSPAKPKRTPTKKKEQPVVTPGSPQDTAMDIVTKTPSPSPKSRPQPQATPDALESLEKQQQRTSEARHETPPNFKDIDYYCGQDVPMSVSPPGATRYDTPPIDSSGPNVQTPQKRTPTKRKPRPSPKKKHAEADANADADVPQTPKTKAKSRTKSKPTPEPKPTPTGKAPGAEEQKQPPSTPPRKKKPAGVTASSTPQSSSGKKGGNGEATPSRRSPRIADKEKMRREGGSGVGVAGHSVM